MQIKMQAVSWGALAWCAMMSAPAMAHDADPVTDSDPLGGIVVTANREDADKAGGSVHRLDEA